MDISLIKRYAGSKRRKELFAFAIWCHIKRVNGVIFDVTSSKLRRHLSIGKDKADRLIADATEDILLFKTKGNTFMAGSLRDKTIKYAKHGHRYCSALVKTIKFDTEHAYTLKELYNLINEILAIFPITAKEEKDCLNKRDDCQRDRSAQIKRDAGSRTLTLKKFSQNVKMSASSCARILKRLVKEGKVAKKISILFTAINSEHKEAIIESLMRLNIKNVTYEHNGLSFIIVPCSYSIADRNVSESYRHKIYNYHKETAYKNSGNKPFSTIPQMNGF